VIPALRYCHLVAESYKMEEGNKRRVLNTQAESYVQRLAVFSGGSSESGQHYAPNS
jgi:hypothetical protein